MGDAKLKASSVFPLEHERNIHSHIERAFSSIVTPSEPSQNVQQSLKLCRDGTIKRSFNTQSCTAGEV